MALQKKALNLVAAKIGLADEPQVLSQATEYERLLSLRLTSSHNVSYTAKYVICLDLASYKLGIPIDVVSALKYSGLKKPAYDNSKSMVEKLLGISELLTIKNVCLKYECTSVEALANSIMKKYKKCDRKGLDMSHRQYVCMAVYQACRHSKVKVAKTKLMSASRLKPMQWNQLESEWTDFVDINFSQTNGKTTGKKTESMQIEKIDDCYDENENAVDESTETQLEDYEVWKARLLIQARKELMEVEQQAAKHNRSPSKSPRKNIASPRNLNLDNRNDSVGIFDKDRSVRLLFLS